MSKSIKEIISDNISRYRRECGFSQKELAEKIGAKNLTTVSSWERGVSSPDADTIIKLCKLFNISLNDLYNVETKNFDLSSNEKSHIKKYRNLDNHGKKTVDFILDNEYERCKNNNGIEEIAPELSSSAEPRLQSDQKEYIDMAARGGKIRIEKDKAIELAKNAKAAPNSANRKDLF
ncbi:helix-turn-helix transcriptional regulator [Anaerotignum sp.]|uniref:helix-turn-helix transcriptional regulator n=1 Tax=Anaerotignum sp. TaxID=2039241 RepID=UPI00289E73BD|nr:helix-turn-helix transcriptional regulator [Anaerotignum sp.]